MWPFIRAKRQSTEEQGTANPERRPLRFAALVANMGDFRALSDNDTAVKFWVPAAVAQALDEWRERDGFSMSQLLRQYLIVHGYGLYAIRKSASPAPTARRPKHRRLPIAYPN